jgi:hypothetical protein
LRSLSEKVRSPNRAAVRLPSVGGRPPPPACSFTFLRVWVGGSRKEGTPCLGGARWTCCTQKCVWCRISKSRGSVVPHTPGISKFTAARVPASIRAVAQGYRGGKGFKNSRCTTCPFSHAHTRARAPRALAMQLLGRAVTARTFCGKSAATHYKMSPLSRANWQHFFSG